MEDISSYSQDFNLMLRVLVFVNIWLYVWLKALEYEVRQYMGECCFHIVLGIYFQHNIPSQSIQDCYVQRCVLVYHIISMRRGWKFSSEGFQCLWLIIRKSNKNPSGALHNDIMYFDKVIAAIIPTKQCVETLNHKLLTTMRNVWKL